MGIGSCFDNLQIKDPLIKYSKDNWAFSSKGSISEKLNLSEDHYSIIINDLFIYNVHVRKEKNIVIEIYPSTSVADPDIFGTWECKKLHGTYRVTFYRDSEHLTKHTIGYIGWYNGCNHCGYIDFMVLSKNKIKLLGPNCAIGCTLMGCVQRIRFSIPKVEWISFRKKRNKLILKFHKKRFRKRMVLKNRKIRQKD